MKTRVVVTGIGLVTPLGNTPQELWRKVAAGESAARPVPDWLREQGLHLAGLCPVENFVPPSGWEQADRQIQFAVATAQSALKDSKLPGGSLGGGGAVYLSSSKGGIGSLEKAHAALRRSGPRAVPADFLRNFCGDAPAAAVAQIAGCRGPVLNFVSACASGAHSIMMGKRWVEENPEGVALAGATEASLTPLILSAFFQMGVLASEGELCRPFDRRRCGFVAGEGCAVLVLESESRARTRGAPIYAELAGAAATADATHPIHFDPSGESIARAVRLAAQNAAVPLEELDYVNLHATGTKENDLLETRGIEKAWQGKTLPALSGTKPATGHLLGASGAVEAAITILALRHQFVPPTLNLEKPDPECRLDATPLVGRQKKLRAAMSLSYGFGGQIAALIFKKWDA